MGSVRVAIPISLRLARMDCAQPVGFWKRRDYGLNGDSDYHACPDMHSSDRNGLWDKHRVRGSYMDTIERR